MHHIYTFWHPSPKHLVYCSAQREIKNAVEYLPSPVLCGQERWLAFGRDSKMSFTAWNWRADSPEKHRCSVHSCPYFTMGKVWITSHISFISSHLLKPFQSTQMLKIWKISSSLANIHFGCNIGMTVLRWKKIKKIIKKTYQHGMNEKKRVNYY